MAIAPAGYSRTSPPELRHLHDFSNRFVALNLGGPTLKALQDSLAHAEVLDTERRTRPALIDSQTDDASVQLAAGEITVDDAVKKVARAASLAAARDTIAEMLDNAAEQAASTARAQFSRAGDKLLLILDKAARDIGTEANELEPLVAEVSTDGEAMRAGEAVRNAWARLGDLAPRLDQIQTLADKLRTYRIVRTERHWDPYEMHYQRPDLLPGIGLESLPKGTHAVRVFLAQIPALPIEAAEGSPKTSAGRIELPDHTGEHPDKMPISFDEFPDDYTPFQ
jgi:hypothetical protein